MTALLCLLGQSPLPQACQRASQSSGHHNTHYPLLERIPRSPTQELLFYLLHPNGLKSHTCFQGEARKSKIPAGPSIPSNQIGIRWLKEGETGHWRGHQQAASAAHTCPEQSPFLHNSSLSWKLHVRRFEYCMSIYLPLGCKVLVQRLCLAFVHDKLLMPGTAPVTCRCSIDICEMNEWKANIK